MKGTSTVKSPVAATATLKAYESKVSAQIQEAKAKLELLEAKAKETKAQADIVAINTLKTAKENINRRIQDLKTTHDSNVPRAKADIDSDVVSFRTAIDELGARLKTPTAKTKK